MESKIDISEFLKVEMRVGTIISADYLEKAKMPAIRMLISFGNRGNLKSSAQLTAFYEPESLVGSQVIAVVNFPPKQIANFISECLVLGLKDEKGAVTLIRPDNKVEDGTILS